ncbi:hypothetical protein GCM10023092_16030 [Rurimicrobium arvi]|uniref:Uncharacterized protein n=2 Tax=Rurimicrobium arvi TaxID=2049916 RepID=A0ABP8MTR2_9BACT
MFFVPLVVCARDTRTYLYKKRVVIYNPRNEQRDTISSYFYLKRDKQRLYLSEGSVSAKLLGASANYIGELSINAKQELIWSYQKQNIIIHSRSDSITTDYDGITQYLFVKGTVYYSGIDTVINGHLCAKFIRHFSGNAGRDIPGYETEEYFDTKEQIFVFVRIIYRKPYRELIVELVNWKQQ